MREAGGFPPASVFWSVLARPGAAVIPPVFA